MKHTDLLKAAAVGLLALLTACGGPTPTAAPPTEPPPTEEPATDTPTEAPTEPPATQGGPFIGVSLEEFERFVRDAIANDDFEAMAQLMADPFTIAFWQSEGGTASPIEAASDVAGFIDEYYPPVFDSSVEVTTLPDGTDPLTMWGPDVVVADVLYSRGWGTGGNTEALVIIRQEPDGSYRWHSILFARGGFGF